MSSNKMKSDRGEIEFTRAAYDAREDAEQSYDVNLNTSVWPTSQRGVWAFVTTVRKGARDTAGRPVITHTEYWPSATDLSWAAFFFQHSFKAARMVEMWALEEKRRKSEQAG